MVCGTGVLGQSGSLRLGEDPAILTAFIALDILDWSGPCWYNNTLVIFQFIGRYRRRLELADGAPKE
jgi:hypothetical protein